MNNIENIFAESRNFENYAKGYLRYISKLLESMDVLAIKAFVEELEKARNGQNTVFIISNGGSAATASHMENDLAFGSCPKEGTYPYRVLSLSDNNAKLTAISNDYGYDKVFVNQLKVHYRSGDKLVVISASGNSKNVIIAADWVKKQGGTVIGLFGFDGGKFKELCDIFIHVVTQKGEYGPVEDVHMIVDHLIYTWLHFKEKRENPK